MRVNERIGNASNKYQGSDKKVLCVCSGGLLRSPTAALVLSHEPYNYNTRSAGISSYALINLDTVLLSWADEIVCMETEHVNKVGILMEGVRARKNKPVICLHIPDKYPYKDPELMDLINTRYKEFS